MGFLEKIISIIAPHSCLGCGFEGAVLCRQCVQKLPVVPERCYRCARPTAEFRTCEECRQGSPLIQVWSATPYEGAAKQLIHALKFERAQAAASDAARAIARVLPAEHSWAVMPVPTATSRVRQRGYDQAQLISRALARHLNRPNLPLLVRSGQTRQVGHSRLERQQYLRAAFRVSQPAAIQNKSILLIDDVLTTGSTLAAAAEVLHAAGAGPICAAVFAAANPRSGG